MEKSELFISSGLKTSSILITAKPARLGFVIATTPGNVAAVCNVYNGTSASGQVVVPLKSGSTVAAAFGTGKTDVFCPNGIYLELSGAGVEAVVHYEEMSFNS